MRRNVHGGTNTGPETSPERRFRQASIDRAAPHGANMRKNSPACDTSSWPVVIEGLRSRKQRVRNQTRMVMRRVFQPTIKAQVAATQSQKAGYKMSRLSM